MTRRGQSCPLLLQRRPRREHVRQRQHAEVGGLARKDWSLRVTQAYRHKRLRLAGGAPPRRPPRALDRPGAGPRPPRLSWRASRPEHPPRRNEPVRQLDTGVYVLELSNGPTLAFKDMAMQLLGNLFEYTLAKQNEELNIFGATSGDTGSAAEYAMRGKKGSGSSCCRPTRR